MAGAASCCRKDTSMNSESGNTETGKRLTILSTSPDDTRKFAQRLGACCIGGESLFLHGDLGSGKTCFVQGLALGLGISAEEPVTSPTFVLHMVYCGRLELNHLDLYRIGENAAAQDGLGFDLMPGTANAVCAIEWAEYFSAPLPRERLDIDFRQTAENQRTITIVSRGPEHALLLKRLQTRHP